MSTIYGFSTWIVPEGGMRWVSTSQEPFEEKSRWLVPQTPGITRIGRRYDIADFPALFRNFADTPVTEEGILEFANEFGELGGFDMVVPPDDWDDPDDVWFRGQSIERWEGQIVAMRNAIQVWDAVKDRNVFALESRLGVLYDEQGRPVKSPVAHDQVNNSLAGDPFLPALEFLRGLIEVNLVLTSPKMVVLQSEYSLALRLKPTILEKALWLQLAQSVEEQRDYRRCKVCTRWFEISSTSKHRKSRQYCSDACRVRAYRERLAGDEAEK